MTAGCRYGRYHQHSICQEEILGPVPPAPMFTETLEDVRERIDVTLPKVAVPKDFGMPPPAVAKLLKRDDEKRERQKGRSYISIWDTPLYDILIQRRRLRLLSAIFLALAKQGCRADTWGSHPFDSPQDDFTITVGHHSVRLRASYPNSLTRTDLLPGRPATTRCGQLPQVLVREFEYQSSRIRRWLARGAPHRRRLRDYGWPSTPSDGKQPDGRVWEDGDTTLEHQARSIVLAIMLKGEQQFRDSAERMHAWRVELMTQTIERLERERAETERNEREWQAAREQKQVEDLLENAIAFRRARDISAYVAEARAANVDAIEPLPSHDMEAWASWALAQADRIDPVRTGAFMKGRNGVESEGSVADTSARNGSRSNDF